MIKLFFIFFLIMRFIPEYLDSNSLYWLLHALLMVVISIFIFIKSEKTLSNLFFSACCLNVFIYDLVDRFIIFTTQSQSLNLLNTFSIISIIIVVHLFIFRNRYKWERQKSDPYDKNKVQAIYSKPKNLLTLFGAAISLSPRCSVRFTNNDSTIRFKKGVQKPFMCETILKESDIIKNTSFDPNSFLLRFEEIKDKKYNIFMFNCKNLLNEN